MRLLTFVNGGKKCVGAERDGVVIDLSAEMPGTTVKSIIGDGRIDEAERAMAQGATVGAIDDVALDLPIADPMKIFCVGVNYMNRNAEYKDGSEEPPYPSWFMRSPMSFAAHRAEILRPPESEQFDYEGEIVLVIGKSGRRIAQSACEQSGRNRTPHVNQGPATVTLRTPSTHRGRTAYPQAPR